MLCDEPCLSSLRGTCDYVELQSGAVRSWLPSKETTRFECVLESLTSYTFRIICADRETGDEFVRDAFARKHGHSTMMHGWIGRNVTLKNLSLKLHPRYTEASSIGKFTNSELNHCLLPVALSSDLWFPSL
jgi:hypothetical protein